MSSDRIKYMGYVFHLFNHTHNMYIKVNNYILKKTCFNYKSNKSIKLIICISILYFVNIN